MATKHQCNRALQRYMPGLEQLPNVNRGFGILPTEEPRPPGAKTDYALVVYVSKKVPADELAEADRVPRFLEIQSRGKTVRVPTRVIEMPDPIELQSPGPS